MEDAKILFATTSTLLIQNTKGWWEEDENETCVPPIAHVSTLANLAWFKQPSISADFQLHELVALCAAAMRPSEKGWQRFLGYLETMQASNRLTPDEATLIIVSAISDKLVYEAEIYNENLEDIDAGTLDEVVARVISQYNEDSERNVAEISQGYELKLAATQAEAEIRAHKAEEKLRSLSKESHRKQQMNSLRAETYARRIVGPFFALLNLGVTVGAIVVVASHDFNGSWKGVLGLAVIVFVVLEAFGVLSHTRSLQKKLQAVVQQLVLTWFEGGSSERSESAVPD